MSNVHYLSNIKIQLLGEFQILGNNGADITPSSAKGRGLLCLLCLSQNFTRSRRWIESILWSDRGHKQAQESLRTELSKIRRAFGLSQDVLITDNLSITLDRSRVIIDILDFPGSSAKAYSENKELFDGVTIRNHNFIEWANSIKHERRNLIESPRPRPNFIVSAKAYDKSDVPGTVLAETLARSIEQQIGEYASVNILAPDAINMQVANGHHGLRLGIRTATIAGGRTDVHISIDSLKDAKRLDMIQGKVPAVSHGLFDDIAAASVTYEASQAVLAAMHASDTALPEDNQTNAWLAQAAGDIMSTVPYRLLQGKVLLDRVSEIEKDNAVAMAWRAMLSMVMRNERVLSEHWLDPEEISYLHHRALELAPRNAFVLGLTSLSASYGTGDLAFARAASDLALHRNPTSPYAIMADAVLALRDEKPHEAVQKAQTARSIAMSSTYLHWWEMAVALAKIAAGDIAAARIHVETACALAPEFRAASRHLYALNLFSGTEAEIEASEKRLLSLEPDFSLDRMRNDHSYPASTIRRAGLLDRI